MSTPQKIKFTIERYAFTQVELIFVIIIIGILAAVAIPRLSAVRDDADLSKDVANMDICIRDMGVIYTATRTNLNDINSNACVSIVCYTIDINGTSIIVNTNSAGANYCADIQNVGGHLAKTYNLAGKTVQR